MNSLDFFATAVSFSFLGYALCYLTMSQQSRQTKKAQTEERGINPPPRKSLD
ncbi:hypothetical protein [Paradesulfitobacterium ferrireducens]|uniref:hypothetical protein n=1 Tax=Paradesulfitobacterium ferrireducens TaxID=2816476 RepID=UPI001A8E00EA|nr:hypothetical protein [Paradesulfitobacterium ferrireducens]